MKWILRFIVRLLFRFRAYNEEVLRIPGPVLLLPNHVSWLDWLFLGVCLEEDWRFVTSKRSAETSWIHGRILINRRTFPIETTSPYGMKHVAEYLQKNGRLVLFSEGRLSRTGSVMKLFDGTGFLLHKTGAKVITCYLRGAHRLPYSPNPSGKNWFSRVSAHFSEVLIPPKARHTSASQARAELTDWLREQLVNQQFRVEMELGVSNLLEAIEQTARQKPRQVILEQVGSRRLTYQRLLLGADLLSGVWRRILDPNQTRVGVLLPNINSMPLTLLSLWTIRKVPAVINYSTGAGGMLAAMRLANLKQLITSREFLERAKISPDAFLKEGLQPLYLEDIRQQITAVQKLAGWVRHHGLGRSRLAPKSTSGSDRNGSDPAVILFTSGSEGMPKGVELSHANILANIRQMLAVTDIEDTDRLFNCLPLFHSFGLTVGTLLPLIRGLYVFLYPSPLHYRVVPTLFYAQDCTIFLSTNTFLNGYARKADPYDFRTLRYLFAAAEKLQESAATTWSRRFGVRVLEGYGATECSPCVSVNTPLALKAGSVGRPLPGIAVKIEPLDGVPDGGRLLVRGPNIMRGYLNPEANAQFRALQGWYDTGDIAQIDSEGYLHILGRLKRFAKISGEMVSLTAIEESLSGAFPQYGPRFQVAVLSRADSEKGEALIAVTNEQRLKLDQIRSALNAKGFSNLFVPREIKYLRNIPKLGTGKVNHRELAQMI